MKNLWLGLLLGILVASVPRAYTQQQPERISIGTVSLELGMNRDAVISRLAEGGYKLSSLNSSDKQNDGWVVNERNEKTNLYDVLGTLQFRNGRLAWALRTWAEAWDDGSAKVGKNLYFLVKSLEESGNTACSITTKLQESPDFEQKESFIRCGRRKVTVGVSRYKQQHEETQVTETVE